MPDLPPGVILHRGYLDRAAQQNLALEIAEVIGRAPLYTCTMPRTGAPMSARMTNCGRLGWLSDREGGYRYVPRHPVTDEAWPAIPKELLFAWERLANYPAPPDACLINVYDAKARMGAHQDRDEKDLTAPVVSLSLGADCRFRIRRGAAGRQNDVARAVVRRRAGFGRTRETVLSRRRQRVANPAGLPRADPARRRRARKPHAAASELSDYATA